MTPEIYERKLSWPEVALIAGGVAVMLLASSSYARASIGDNQDRRGYERSTTIKKTIAKAPQKYKKRPVLLAKKRVDQPAKTAMLPHPPGCPRIAFCGCGAAWDLKLGLRRDLWLATAWLRFPKAAPAHNRVAVRTGHVFVLKEHIRGNVWLAADYNSGGHKSRLHARSIAGYVIVNPASRVARL